MDKRLTEMELDEIIHRWEQPLGALGGGQIAIWACDYAPVLIAAARRAIKLEKALELYRDAEAEAAMTGEMQPLLDCRGVASDALKDD